MKDDTISRQAVIDSLHSKFVDGFDSDRWWNSMSVLYAINKVPSVSTEKTGRWEWNQYDSNQNIGNWHCSECNRIVCGAITAAKPVYSYKYCPNCGAKMEVEE